MMESHVGIAAVTSLPSTINAALGTEGAAHDLDAGLWTAERATVGGAEYSGDDLRLSAEAGLGIAGLAS